jgi:hypothetical protein
MTQYTSKMLFQELYKSFRQTYRGKAFEETLSNVALSGSMVITGGATNYIFGSTKAAAFFSTWYGKATFDLAG